MTMTRQQAGRKGGQTTAARYGPVHLSRIGQAGYRKAIERDPQFHHKGGQATAALYRHTQAGTGAAGVEAALLDGHVPKKRHRYLGGCTCCGRPEGPGRFTPDHE